VPPTETRRAGQLRRKKLDLAADARLAHAVVPLFGLARLLVQLAETALVRGDRRRIQRLARVAAVRLAAGGGEVERVDLPTGLGDESGDIADPAAVFEAHRCRAHADQPRLTLTNQRQRRVDRMVGR